MKKVILSMAALMLLTAATYAQDAAIAQATAVSTTPETSADGVEKKKIEEKDLPAAIKKVLATDQYKDWKVVAAWHVAGENEHYLLDMKKGDESTLLKFNKDGQII